MPESLVSPHAPCASAVAPTRPRVVVALEPGERGRAVAVRAGLLSAALDAETDAVALPAAPDRDFTVERGGRSAPAPLLADIAAPRTVTVHAAGASAARTLWELCRDATFLVVSESSAHLVMPLDPESLYPRSALPGHCAIVVVPDAADEW